jgi:hypothetical protein
MTADRDQLPRQFEPGDVLHYTPSGAFEPMHCRQATAVVYEDGRAVDTFWGIDDRSDGHVLNDKELETAELKFRLGEFRKLGEHWDRKNDEWMTYAPADRQRIGSQHQYQSTYYVRIGAEPDLDTQIANARAELEEAEEAVKSAERRLCWKREDLAKLEGQRVTS